MTSSEQNTERTWAAFAHLSALLGILIPFGNLIAPLAIWLLKKNESAFIDDQGKESLNFQISVLIYGFIAAVLVFVAIGIFLLSSSVQGWFYGRLNVLFRAAMLGGALCMIHGSFITDVVGVGIGVAIFMYQRAFVTQKEPAAAQ